MLRRWALILLSRVLWRRRAILLWVPKGR